jgi:hypothetical protein
VYENQQMRLQFYYQHSIHVSIAFCGHPQGVQYNVEVQYCASKERGQLAEASKEGLGSEWAVVPMMMIITVLCTLRMVVKGHRNMQVLIIKDIHNFKCIYWFLCINEKFTLMRIMEHKFLSNYVCYKRISLRLSQILNAKDQTMFHTKRELYPHFN